MSLACGGSCCLELNVTRGRERHTAGVYGWGRRRTGWVESTSWSRGPGRPHVGLQCSAFLPGLCAWRPACVARLLGVSVILAMAVWEEMKSLPSVLVYFLINEH